LDLSYMRTIPGMTILAPSDENQLRSMLHYAIYDCEGPVAIRFPRGNAYATEVKPEFAPLQAPKFYIVEEGKDVLLIGAGFMLAQLRIAANLLKENGVQPTLVDARFIKPLDVDGYCKLLGAHSLVVTLEDNALPGGFGSALSELITDNGVQTKLVRLGLPDAFVEHGEIPQLYRELGLDGESVARKILKQLAERR